nr:cache domain-containing protein [Acidaminobacter sp. JC074]
MEFFDENYRGWYEVPIAEKRPVWTFPYLSIAGGSIDQIITSYVVPLEKDGLVIGVAGMDLYLTDVIRYLENSRLYESGEVYLLYPDGRTIYHPRYEFGKVPDEINDFNQWLDIINANDYGSLEVEAEKQMFVLAYMKLENGWTMASMIPKGEVFDVFGNLIVVMILIVTLTIIFAFIISNYMSRRLSNPIVSISTILSDISHGNLAKTIPDELLNSNTEISRLVESAESMRKHLIDDLNRVRFDNEHLESLVNERTAELSKVNAELEASLDQLESQQAVILEAEKSKTSRYLIQNLAHRLNTPIGSTLIASDYLKSIDFSTDQAVLTSIDIIHTSQQNLKEIVDGMSKLLKNYDDMNVTQLNLKTTIDYCVKKFMFENDVKIPYENLVTEDIEIQGVSNLYLEMFAHILLYSYKENQTGMKVDIKYENDTIKYADTSILFDEKFLRIFEAYFDVNIHSDKHGLEMFIAYDIATRGLGYKMYVNPDNRDHLEIWIETKNV